VRRRTFAKLIGATGLVAVLVTSLVVTSFAKSSTPTGVGPIVTVSGASPFAGCNIGSIGDDGLPGTNYASAEVEPRVAVNPANPSNMIGVWQQDRWSNGGAHGLVAAYTTDGGKTWTQSSQQPTFSECAGGTAANGGDFERASDPWITFSNDGAAFMISLSATFNTSFQPDSAILVSKSTDGGKTWGPPVTLRRDSGRESGFFFFNDKESITADPVNSQFVYAVWDRQSSPTPKSNSSIIGVEHAKTFHQPVWFARSIDEGQTWQPASIIFEPGQFSFTIGSQIVVLPDGTLLDVFDTGDIGSTGKNVTFTEEVIRSTDHGQTWSKKPVVIGADEDIGVSDPFTGAPLRTGAGLPDVAVDRSNGAVYVVWEDARFSGLQREGIAFSKSTDGGLTWSTPQRVNQVPSTQAFTPSIMVASDGTVAVTYYDLRNATSSDLNVLATDYWIVRSHDGGATFSEDHIAGSFNELTAPNAGGFFLGDYEGLGPVGASFLPFFVQAQPAATTGPTDTFATTVSP
jgi:Neuraminidase (sialidase)